MEEKMDMPPKPDGKQMPMDNVHNTFWRDDQITILFQSDLPLVTAAMLNKEPLQSLQLPVQLQKLNEFLREQQVPVTLDFLGGTDRSSPDQPTPSQDEGDRSDLAGLQLPAGIYPFGLMSPIKSSYGLIRTYVISCFQTRQTPSQGGSNNTTMTMPTSDDDGTDNGDHSPAYKLIPTIVNTLNKHLDELHKRQVPIAIAAPTWLSGATGGTGNGGQGCPLTPPLPVEDTCSRWHIELPDLPPDLQARTGDSVTVFILDSFPERGVIARAAQDAGDDNWLLRNINETVTFDYSLLSGVQEAQNMLDTQNAFVGKDVYGRHYPIQLTDHGLFIAGIVRDVAPRARIECIRVLNDLCVGDTQLIAQALWRIYQRKALQSGDLYGKPVVVNLSLVIPTADEASSQGVDTTIGSSSDIWVNVWANVGYPLRSLSELGVIIAASAGNEADLREDPTGNRPSALYPAALGNPPYSLNGIIPVGAVNSTGNAASYSCYPGIRGVATYGGEVPTVTPPQPPSANPIVRPSDTLRGIYSSVEYPPLSSDPPEQYYAAPNNHAWAYWVGTSFATPIVSALAARVWEAAQQGAVSNVQEAILNAATRTTQWDRLAPDMPGTVNGTIAGPVIVAIQKCRVLDRDEDDEVPMEIEITG
jgi:hypothetical protein